MYTLTYVYTYMCACMHTHIHTNIYSGELYNTDHLFCKKWGWCCTCSSY